MQLDVGYNSRSIPASEQGIPYAIRNLPGMNQDDSFVILSDGKGRFIKVVGGDRKFQLEYAENGGKKYYWTNDELSEQEVVNAFLSFWKQDGQFRRNINWHRDTSTSEKIQLGVIALIIGSLAFYTGLMFFKELLF